MPNLSSVNMYQSRPIAFGNAGTTVQTEKTEAAANVNPELGKIIETINPNSVSYEKLGLTYFKADDFVSPKTYVKGKDINLELKGQNVKGSIQGKETDIKITGSLFTNSMKAKGKIGNDELDLQFKPSPDGYEISGKISEENKNLLPLITKLSQEGIDNGKKTMENLVLVNALSK